MKKAKYSWLIAMAMGMGFASCTDFAGLTDMDEKVYGELSADVYYQDRNSVEGAVASIYNQAGTTYPEYFFQLQEYSADQIAWRTWNGGQWGWDEAEKFVLSTHTWSAESKIISSAWSNSWTIVGLANQLLGDLENIDAAAIGITEAEKASYVAEVRLMRAWSYYSLFELWGGALPLNTSVTTDIPGSADPDFNTSCRKIYDFIMTELDETLDALPKETGNNATRTRMNQGVNRILKARMYLNSEIFIGEKHFAECEALCKQIINGEYGEYSIDSDYRHLYSIGNTESPEVVFAFATMDGQGANFQLCNNRNMQMMPYNYNEYCGIEKYSDIGAWNCTCLAPSYDNSGEVQPEGGTVGAKCFLDAPYNDKLGAVWERFDDNDIRKQNFVFDGTEYKGMFLRGPMYADFGTGAPLKCDADRQDQDLVYVDQVGTFLNLGTELQTVMSPRWGETNSGIRMIKYPMYEGSDFKNIAEVEFRLAEVYYMVAECEMRAGNANEAKKYVDAVRARYFTNGLPSTPGRGFSAYDMDWMLSQWGIEYLGEGRRRRTDLRRFDKFTQGQWWFFGRAQDAGFNMPAKRDRKYEWFPLPATALLVNPGLVQNPGY